MYILALQRMYADPAIVRGTGVHKGLQDGFIGILQFYIFAHQDDVHFVGRVFDAFQELFPPGQVGRCKIIDLQLADGQFVQMLLVHVQGNLVDAPGVDALDDVAGTDIAEEGNLAAQFRRQRVLCPANDDIRPHTALLEGLHRVLGGLGLEFFGGAQIRDERQVDGHGVLFRQFPLQLAHRLHEGLRFHITNGSADFRQNDVVLSGTAQQEHPALDFVRNVGDNLHGFAQVGALALLGNDRVINLAGGYVVGLGSIDAQVALIMSEVQVGLGAILGHIAFAMLVGIQGPGVDVDVGVEFLDGHPQASCLQEFSQRRSDDSFSQRGSHAARNKDILRIHNGIQRYDFPFKSQATF